MFDGAENDRADLPKRSQVKRSGSSKEEGVMSRRAGMMITGVFRLALGRIAIRAGVSCGEGRHSQRRKPGRAGEGSECHGRAEWDRLDRWERRARAP